MIGAKKVVYPGPITIEDVKARFPKEEKPVKSVTFKIDAELYSEFKQYCQRRDKTIQAVLLASIKNKLSRSR